MNILGFNIERKAQSLTLDQFIHRLHAIYATVSGESVTPDSALKSPTVQAIVTAVSRRISTLPVQIIQKSEQDGREVKRHLPNHPIANLLNSPNPYQDRISFWLDATSWLLRYGNFYAVKGQGRTGPIRTLTPVNPDRMEVKYDPGTGNLTYLVHEVNGQQREYLPRQILHARGPAQDGITGDSPVMLARESIGIELAAEQMAATVFGNDAMPGMVFEFLDGFQGWKTDEEKSQFINDFQKAYGQRGRHKAMILPKGLGVADSVSIENDKAQFLESRQYQRTVIAASWGVPVHMVGDLTKGTYSNIQNQNRDFQQAVVLPFVRMFEAAMERALLSDADRAEGITIEFNLEGPLRANFLERQQGLNIQRQAGVISPNEWRNAEGMNPREDGDTYYEQGPSGQEPENTEEEESESLNNPENEED